MSEEISNVLEENIEELDDGAESTSSTVSGPISPQGEDLREEDAELDMPFTEDVSEEDVLFDKIVKFSMSHGRIEYEDEEEVFKTYVEAAICDLEESGVPRLIDDPLYILAVARLSNYYYDHREEDVSVLPPPRGVSSMVFKLRLKYAK